MTQARQRQLDMWLEGRCWHNTVDNKCLPDNSCCSVPTYDVPEYAKRLYIKACVDKDISKILYLERTFKSMFCLPEDKLLQVLTTPLPQRSVTEQPTAQRNTDDNTKILDILRRVFIHVFNAIKNSTYNR